MTTKTISIMDDVYERIKTLKAPGESFSDILRRITSKVDIMEFAGSWKDITDEELKKIESKLSDMRKGNRLKEMV